MQTNDIFESGVFPLSATDYYYAPIDLLYLTNPIALPHEVAHRIFSVASGGFYALRTLAEISHRLFETLFRTLDQQDGRLVGNSLGTLHVVNFEPSVVAENLIERIQYVEALFDMCHWDLLPIAEIAAIDFGPNANASDWYPRFVKDSKSKRSRKEAEADKIAQRLTRAAIALGEDSFYRIIYDDVAAEFKATWEAYQTVQDPDNREAILHLTMTNILQPDPDSELGYIVDDSLRFLRGCTALAQQAGAKQRLYSTDVDMKNKTGRVLIEIANEVLGDIPGFSHEYLGFASVVETLLVASFPETNPVQATSQSEFETTSNPYRSLLTMQQTQTGRRRLFVNPGYQFIVEHQMLPELSHISDKEWWRSLVAVDTVRTAIKNESHVFCPFKDVDGANCHPDCAIRKQIGWLQQHSVLVNKDAVCSLGS